MTIPIPALLLLLIICLMLIIGCSKAPNPAPIQSETEPEQARRPVRILFIGNSLTFCNNLPRMVKHLARNAHEPLSLVVDSSAFAGATLGNHWDKGEALEKIRNGGWSYVVLQGQSSEPIDDKEGFFEHMRLFDEEIKKCGAKTLLYMTWALQKMPEQQQQISTAYQEIGQEIGAQVVPVGLAWRKLLDARPDAPLYTGDGKHPSPHGTYLAACVFHAVLNNHSPSGLPAEIPQMQAPEKLLVKLSRNDAAYYEQIARESVQANTESPNP